MIKIKIDLIQPRHNFAPQKGLGHIFMPTSLLTVAARLLYAGVDINFYDENFRQAKINAEVIGINAVGVPYIPEIIKLQERIKKTKSETNFLIGGQPVNTTRDDGFTLKQFNQLFGENTYDGNNDTNLFRLLNITQEDLPQPEQTSLIPAYNLISDKDMKEYLSRTFPLYVAQGCKNACHFCPAQNRIKEKYRNQEVIKKDLDYLVKRAKKLNLHEIRIYVSNLDIFQTPTELYKFARMVNRVKDENKDFNIRLRGLATLTSYLNVRNNQPEIISELVKAGIHTIGFGVDGWETWAKVGKGHNTKKKCIQTISSAQKDYNITPEIVMVFGHVSADNKETLQGAYEFVKNTVKEYGAIPRPHIAKEVVPGNSRWRDPKYTRYVEQLIANPELFQAIDFTALPTELTHPDPALRELTQYYFLKMCSLLGNTTLYCKPIQLGMTSEEKEQIRLFNIGRYDR